MTGNDLSMVLAWRNHPEIRRYMFNQAEIGADEHRQWFEAASSDPNRHLLIFEPSAEALGFVSLRVGTHPNVADWGFYVAPQAPRGTGRTLGRCALDHAFGTLALHKVCGQAIEFNSRSIEFHRALGFTQEGVLREQHREGDRYHAVVCFGLLGREWSAGVGS